MVEVFSHTGRCRQDNGRNCLTCTLVIFSGFLDAVIKQFLFKEQLLRNRRKQSFPKKIFGSLSFRGLSFRGLSFRGLRSKVLVFEVLGFDTPFRNGKGDVALRTEIQKTQ